jgi:hypothetical protein
MDKKRSRVTFAVCEEKINLSIIILKQFLYKSLSHVQNTDNEPLSIYAAVYSLRPINWNLDQNLGRICNRRRYCS